MWQCYQILSGFLFNGHLPRVSRQSRLLANDKGEYEKIPEVVHRSPGIYLTAEKTLENLSQETVASNEVPLPQNKICGIAHHVIEGEGRKGVKDYLGMI